jgi:lipopolysaccharide biosynthesis protein/glycosyltransferase involved in cell wall biosynthesis
MKKSPKKRLIVVLGMHRSGTSAITRALKVMGVSLGDSLMSAVSGDNEKGYWEDLDINKLNIELLQFLSHDWHTLAPITHDELKSKKLSVFSIRAIELLREKMKSVGTFAMKDPRTARLLPFWQAIFAHLEYEVSYIITIRNPLSIVKSLNTRSQFAGEKSYYLWLEHVVPSIQETAGKRRVVVDYDRLMDMPSVEVSRIAISLGFDGKINSDELHEYETEFIEAKLRHTRYYPQDIQLDPAAPPMVTKVFGLLDQVAADELSIDSSEIRSYFEKASVQLNEISPALRYMTRQDGQIGSLNQAVAERDGQIANLNQAVAERDGQIGSLNQAVAERDGQIGSLNQAVAERDGQIANLNQAVAERDGQIGSLNQAVAERDGQIANLNQAVAERDGQIANLNQAVAERDGQIAILNQAVAERDGQIANLNQAVAERDGQLRNEAAKALEQLNLRNEVLRESQRELARVRDEAGKLRVELDGRQEELRESQGELTKIRHLLFQKQKTIGLITGALSWRITKPLRRLSRAFPSMSKALAAGLKTIYWITRFKLRYMLRRRKTIRQIAGTGLFDAAFYLRQYPDVLECGANPLEHFCDYGIAERRKPNVYFDTSWYLLQNPNVAQAGVNPLLHYFFHGKDEGRFPSEEAFLKNRLDARQGEIKKICIGQEFGKGKVAGPVDLISGLKINELGALVRDHDIVAVVPGPAVRIIESIQCQHGADASFNGQRVAVLAHWDPDAVVDPYVIYYLAHFKELGWSTVLISGKAVTLTEDLTQVIDAVLYRTCPGYDFTSWKGALEYFPSLREAEELILTNDSVFAPVGSLAPIHSAMQEIECDYWGPVGSREHTPHLQSYYLVFRRKALRHEAFARFWAGVQPDANRKHAINCETILSPWLALNGLQPAVYAPIPPLNDEITNPSHDSWKKLIEIGIPFFKRELLKENARNAIIADCMDVLADAGYPIHLIANYLKRIGVTPTVAMPPCALAPEGYWPPDVRVLEISCNINNCAQLLPAERERIGNVGVFLHIYYEDLTEELVQCALCVPEPRRVYISTDSEAKEVHIRKIFEQYGIETTAEIRVLPNRGWDIAPFLVGFADRIREHSILLRLHTKRSLHIAGDYGTHWQQALLNILAGSRERTQGIMRAFAQNPELGMVCPPHAAFWKDSVHFGGNYFRMEQLLSRFGISIRPDLPIDFPMGSMFWCRSRVLEPWLEMQLRFEDFEPTLPEKRDQTLAHCMERLFFFGCGITGYRWTRLPVTQGSTFKTSLPIQRRKQQATHSMLVFTCCTNNYIPKARILSSTLKSIHPDWTFCLVLCEDPPQGFDLANEPFDRMLSIEELNIPNFSTWLFHHRLVEICTATKGLAMYHFLEREGHEKVIYLDPDIMVMNSLSPLADLLDEHDILLTPHQLSPQPDLDSVVHNEICSLQHGVYNLGFVGVARREQGIAFAQWWRDRLYHFCYDDIPGGLFTDQRWCDLAPAFFSKLHIIRDPGYNAASWNLTDRTITRRADGEFMANNSCLRFYHFTGFDSGAGHAATQVFGKGMPAVFELWTIYEEKLKAFGHAELGKCGWKYACFPNGEQITDDMRLLYRVRPDLQQVFPNPFDFSNPTWNYLVWYKNQAVEGESKVRHKWTKVISLMIILEKKYVKSPRDLLHNISNAWKSFRLGGVRGFLHKAYDFAHSALASESLQGQRMRTQPATTEPLTPLREINFNIVELRTLLAPKEPLGTAAEKDANSVLLYSLLGRKNCPVCIIDHNWGGGANEYRATRIQQYLQAGQAVLLATYNQRTCLVELEAMHGSAHLSFTANNLRELEDSRFPRLDRIIINELISWMTGSTGMPTNLIGDIPRIVGQIVGLARTHTAAMEYMFHDFFSVCPSLNLLDKNYKFCGIPADPKHCDACLKNNSHLCSSLPKGFTIDGWRAAWKELIINAEKLVFFSESTRRIVERAYPVKPEQVEIVSHTPLIEYAYPIRIPKNGGMTIAVVGNICKHKGGDIVIEVARLLLNDEPTARVVVIGEIEAYPIPSNMLVTGKYVREKLPELLEHYHVTVGLMPSICPETFSYVTQELMALALPLVCFDLGAPAERIGPWEHGLIAPETNAKSALETLQKLDARRFAESMLLEPAFDKNFLAPDVPMSKIVSHERWRGYLYKIGNKPGMRILEIGSREVTGESHARKELCRAEYVGFDYYPGRNVDVVGDAHKLSSYFQGEEKFDIVYSSACLEHFAMPWIVATEIAKLLKVGGIVFVETHFSFSSHERPWNFFQFSDMALRVLFSEELGFECIEAGMSNPIVGRFSSYADEYLKNKRVTGLYCHSEYLGEKTRDVMEFDWGKVDLTKVLGGTVYPGPNA